MMNTVMTHGIVNNFPEIFDSLTLSCQKTSRMITLAHCCTFDLALLEPLVFESCFQSEMYKKSGKKKDDGSLTRKSCFTAFLLA